MNSLSNKPACLATQRPFALAGFSLVEMMISIAIGLVIVAALVGVLVSNSSSSKSNDKTAELQSNGRFALNHLQHELRLAGYRGYTARAPESGGWTTPTITNECGTAGSFVKNIRQGVWGSNDSNPFAANCIPSTDYNSNVNSDVLVIRHAANSPILAANAVVNNIYLRTSYSGASLMQGLALPAAAVAGTANYAMQEYVYYIGKDDADATVPALRRVALTGNAMQSEMVVSGIEQIQFQFGITNVGNTQYFNANAITGDHSATGATTWDQVNSVRIWILARNTKPESGYINNNPYIMGNITYGPKNDGYRRQLFTAVAQLRNFRQ